MMAKTSKFLMAATVLVPLAVASTGESLAAPVPSNMGAVKAAAPGAQTDVRYRSHVARPYNYYSSDPYGYPPGYGDSGYSYWDYPTYTWGYPTYYSWGYPTDSYWGYPSYYGYAYGW
jgi:hypothetical protein